MTGDSDNIPIDRPDGDEDAMHSAAMDRAAELNRIQTKAWMLSPKPTNEQIQAVRDRVAAYRDEHRISLTQLSKLSNYSPGSISSFLKGTYLADNAGIAHALNNAIERDARKREARRPKDFVKTGIAQDFRTYVCLADRQNSMCVLVAPAGVGKTLVVKMLAEEFAGLYVCATVHTTMRGLLLLIAKELGYERRSGSSYELEQFIVSRLKGTGRIIFIDEAHLLGGAVQSIRSIHDATECPVVLIGTDAIESSVDDHANGRGQFSSRTIFYSAMDRYYNAENPNGSPDAGQDLFTAEEVREFFAKRKIRLDRDGFKMMWALACLPGFGCLRLVERVVGVAISGVEDENGVISKDELIAALLLIERKRYHFLERLINKQAKRWDAPTTAAAVA